MMKMRDMQVVNKPMAKVDRESRVREEEEIVSRINRILMPPLIVSTKIQDRETVEEDS